MDMAEYIEREAAYSDFENCNAENPKWTPNRVKALIARQPAGEVAPVRHGRWKYGTRAAICTNCGFERSLDDNFGRALSCPNCGARMGGDG